jgi:serine/threonine-protein kinase mTOR
MSSDTAAKVWDTTINREIFDLVHSTHNHEKLGGLLAIGASVSIEKE